MLGVTAMTAGWQAVFYGVGCLAFLYAVVDAAIHRVVNAVALGLLLVFFVAFWQSLALT